jgi:pyruvate ferredoxin oxidoreductase alpha subunit
VSQVVAITGNEAIAEAMRQIDPDVVGAYPITPSTQVVENFSQFVADGKVGTNFVAAESEHSAMSICIGAAAAGGRVMTATSANGLALMWEMLYIASGSRLPIVMNCVNRALSGPLNIHGDHSDAMGARDSGWVQLFSESAQEAYDNTLQAIRISEAEGIRLPVMVCSDGFITSHSIDRVVLEEDGPVREFLGEFQPFHPLLDVDNPVTYGAADLQDYYTEHKRQQAEAMRLVAPVIAEVGREFGRRFGREYGFFEGYRLKDAEYAVVVLGSAAGTARVVVDALRAKGVKAGLLKLRVFRPFPVEEIAEALGHVAVVGVMDRADSFGASGGAVFHEVRSALYPLAKRPLVADFIYGLGGRDLFPEDIDRVFAQLRLCADAGKVDVPYQYLTVRD